MENILIGGESVEVPPAVVTAGRAAVQAWHREQLTQRGIAFTVGESGDPVFPEPPVPDPAADTPADASADDTTTAE